LQYFLHFVTIFAIFDDFSKFCSTFGSLYFEKSSNILQKVWRKWGKIIQLFYYLKMVAFGTKNVSVHWEIKSLRRDFHLILVEIFSVWDEQKASPKTEKFKIWKVERLTQSWNVETKLASLEHSFIFNNCHFNLGKWPCNFQIQLKLPNFGNEWQIKMASVMLKLFF